MNQLTTLVQSIQEMHETWNQIDDDDPDKKLATIMGSTIVELIAHPDEKEKVMTKYWGKLLSFLGDVIGGD